MPAEPSDNDLCQALLGFVADGRFPESDDVVSSEFPAAAASKGLEIISTARAGVESEISTLSRETAPGIDGWILQAKQLHADIERSRVTAREIVVQHEKGQQLQRQAMELAERVEDLQNEIAFTQTISETFKEVRAIQSHFTCAYEALDEGKVHDAFTRLRQIETALETTMVPEPSHIFRILSSNRLKLRESVGRALTKLWNEYAHIDGNRGRMTVSDSMGSSAMEGLLGDLTKLGLFDAVVDSLKKDFLAFIVQPVLATGGRTLSVEGNTLHLGSETSGLGIAGILDALLKAFGFLQKHLPSKIVEHLTSKLFPTISSELISEWISPAIPTDISSVSDIERLVEEVTRFADTLKEQGWQGAEDVISWSRQVPRLWLNKRRAQSLDGVRNAIIGCSGKTRTVERVEKEEVSKKDDVLAENVPDDDWDAAWASDNENKETIEQANDDEDVSAWGLGEEDDDVDDGSPELGTTETNGEAAAGDEDDLDDAWGWGEDDEDDTTTHPTKSSKEEETKVGSSMSPRREVTLKEFYEVTDIPTSVMSIVSQQISDGELLARPENANTKVAASGPALFALPTLIIAMFKATAPLFYPQKFQGGQMLLYNDSMYLAEQLKSFSDQHNMSRLNTDISSIEAFGRMAYGKEMHAQRTILTDLLDGCQGFANCSEEPFLSECGNSMSVTVGRLRDVHKEWAPILSRSALLQSIGSLLSTIIEKIIIDIEDLSDISDAESQKLAGFCNSVSKLEDLFLTDRRPNQDNGEGSEPIPMTAMYVPNWLKFQYLINILESSLADIKFLWNEGELKLEFSEEEVVDLIRALFADSDHRRRAITEIRRSMNS